MISIAFFLATIACVGVCIRYAGPIAQGGTPLVFAVSGAIMCFVFASVSILLAAFGTLTQAALAVALVMALLGLLWVGKSHFKKLDIIETVGSALLAVPYFIMTLVPIWYRDSLTYHAALPKQYAQLGGYTHGDQVIFSYFPQGWHSFLAGWMTLMPNSNPRIIAACMTVLCIWFVLGGCRLFGASKRQSWTVTIIFVLIPTQIEFGSSLYVQNALMLFTGLACLLSTTQKPHLVIWAGLAAGFCASLKLSGLYVIALILLWRLLKRQHVVSFVVAAALAASPFYIRNFIEIGNPFFPLLWELFGGSGWDEWRSQAYGITLKNYGSGRTVTDFVLLPFRVVLARDMQAVFEGSIGPVALFVIGVGLYREKNRAFLRYMAVGWALVWALNVQQIRFLMPVIPILLISTASTLPKQGIKLGAILIFSFLWCYEPALYLWNRQATSQIVSGDLTKDAFLRGKLPENYPVYQWLNKQNTTGVWLVWMRGYHYYLDVPTKIDNIFGAWRFEQLLEKHQTPEGVIAELKNERIEAVAINHRFFLEENNADLQPGRTAVLIERFKMLVDSKALTVVFEHGPVKVYSPSIGVPFDLEPEM